MSINNFFIIRYSTMRIIWIFLHREVVLILVSSFIRRLILVYSHNVQQSESTGVYHHGNTAEEKKKFCKGIMLGMIQV
jgi:hypothetical protein